MAAIKSSGGGREGGRPDDACSEARRTIPVRVLPGLVAAAGVEARLRLLRLRVPPLATSTTTATP
eukprot:711416-Rhodomonas_salina.1